MRNNCSNCTHYEYCGRDEDETPTCGRCAYSSYNPNDHPCNDCRGVAKSLNCYWDVVKSIPRIDSEIEDVVAFVKKFHICDEKPSRPKPLAPERLQERIAFLQEELDELKEAATSRDFTEQADALVDIVYVAKGTAIMMGLPWEHLWNEVQRSNMAKVPATKTARLRKDAIKPDGWLPPTILAILERFGYRKPKPLKGHVGQ